MRKFLRDNGLTLTMFGLFLIFWSGQGVAGYRTYNHEQREHNEATISFGSYLGTGHFWQATSENWESEYLQMAAYVFLTIFLFQKGSSESKDPDKPEAVDEDPREARDEPDAPWPVRAGGLTLKLYENSLGLAFLVLFIASWLLHAISGTRLYNDEQLAHGGETISTGEFITNSEFWFESFQNWQSEFLAVGSIVILSVFLRQRGSPESKAVADPHGKTGTA